MSASGRVGWELRNERNKTGIRWLLLLVIGGYLIYLLDSGQGQEIGTNQLFNWYFIGGLLGGIFLCNLLVRLYIALCQHKQREVHPILKYLTMIVDLAVISLALIPTGGDQSMFFVVYFVVIISNSLRYGMRLTIVALLFFNVFYVGILIYQYPHLLWMDGGLAVRSDTGESSQARSGFALQRELLKIGVFWLVGIYTGYIARRYEYLQGEVEKHQRLMERLMLPARKAGTD